MEKIVYPAKEQWPSLMTRASAGDKDLSALVSAVFEDVKGNGDVALRKYTRMYDGVSINNLLVDSPAIEQSENKLSPELRDAINMARRNIEFFHSAQAESKKVVETVPGVRCWRESRAIEKVGLYIPGGSAPLFSTVLMLAIPARIAGCQEVILCTPPDKNGEVDPAILYTAKITGVTKIFRVGGIQAIAAMTLGTQSIPPVDKIFGPGNRYVTAAKMKALESGIAIDMPAGPSELLIIADKSGNSNYIAADLLSQAEHGPDSQVFLLSDDNDLIDRVLLSVDSQLTELPRRDIAAEALKNSRSVLMETIDDCISFSNWYAPEHLILATSDPLGLTGKVTNAGSVFIGNLSCESAGDYASGTNHTLPTNGFARSYSGISLDSFLKKITFQEILPEGIRNIGPAIITMAEAEGLRAHANAISVRIK